MDEQGINDKMNELAESLVHEIELLIERVDNYRTDIMQLNQQRFEGHKRMAREVIDKIYKDIWQHKGS